MAYTNTEDKSVVDLDEETPDTDVTWINQAVFII